LHSILGDVLIAPITRDQALVKIQQSRYQHERKMNVKGLRASVDFGFD
jgi:hypothetical protein